MLTKKKINEIIYQNFLFRNYIFCYGFIQITGIKSKFNDVTSQIIILKQGVYITIHFRTKKQFVDKIYQLYRIINYKKS